MQNTISAGDSLASQGPLNCVIQDNELIGKKFKLNKRANNSLNFPKPDYVLYDLKPNQSQLLEKFVSTWKSNRKCYPSIGQDLSDL